MGQARRASRGRWTGDERGQSALEFVFVLPFVFVVIFLVVEATSILKTWMLLENASREGARAAAVQKPQSEVCTATRSSGGETLSGVACGGGGGSCASSPSGGTGITVLNAQGAPGTPTCVLISYTYTYATPLMNLVSAVSGGWVPPAITMNAKTVMRLE